MEAWANATVNGKKTGGPYDQTDSQGHAYSLVRQRWTRDVPYPTCSGQAAWAINDLWGDGITLRNGETPMGLNLSLLTHKNCKSVPSKWINITKEAARRRRK